MGCKSGGAAARRKGAAVRRRGGEAALAQAQQGEGGGRLIPGVLLLLLNLSIATIVLHCNLTVVLKLSETPQGGSRAQNGGLPGCWTPSSDESRRLGHVPEDHVNVRHSLHQDRLGQRDPHARREHTTRPLHDVIRGIRASCTTVRHTLHLHDSRRETCYVRVASLIGADELLLVTVSVVMHTGQLGIASSLRIVSYVCGAVVDSIQLRIPQGEEDILEALQFLHGEFIATAAVGHFPEKTTC